MNPIKPLLLAIALAACAPGHANGPQAAQAATANAPVPLLWKVSDADSSLYLLGSFHMLKAEDYPLSADIDAAFELESPKPAAITTADRTAPDVNARGGHGSGRAGFTRGGSRLAGGFLMNGLVGRQLLDG